MTKIRAVLITVTLAALLAALPAGARTTPRLIGTVGFGQITFKDVRGRTVKRLNAGRYSVTAVDRSTSQNFHMLGKGVDVKTKIGFQGTKIWLLVFRKGTTVKYFSDRAPKTLKGSFRVA